MYDKIQTEIYFSDLSYECQEKIKKEVFDRLKDDPETMEDINIKIRKDCIDDGENFELLTQKQKDWRIESILDEMVEDIINREFYGSAEIGDDY